MIEIRIPKEIRGYKEKLFFGLTIRQTICTIIAVAINIPLYIYGRQFVGDEIASWIVIILAVPIMMIGYFNYNQMPFEKFLLVFFITNFLYPQKRKYKTENFYERLIETKRGEKDAKAVWLKDRGKEKSAQNRTADDTLQTYL